MVQIRCSGLISDLGDLDVSKNRGKTPKMDGENNGKPYVQMDDLGVPLFLETPICRWTNAVIFFSRCIFLLWKK